MPRSFTPPSHAGPSRVTQHRDASLGSRIVRGLAWKVGSEAFGQVFRIVVAIMLARLLAPADYGVAAMALVLTSLVPIFADLALGAALVQRKELSEDDRSTVFWTSVAAGVVFTTIAVASAGAVAAFYGEPQVKPLFMALGLTFLISSLGTTQAALLTREMDFRSLELRVMAGSFVGGIVGVAVAAGGGGAWALIGQQLAIVSVSTALLWRFSPWRPTFRFSRQSIRELGGFSGQVFGARLLFYANRNVDAILIGRFLGAKALGAYALAYNVMLSPLSRLAWPIQTVFFPAFASIQDDRERMARMWLRVNRLVAAVTVPAMAGLVVVAPEFVRVVLGDRWSSAIPVIQVLAVVGLLQSLQSLNSSILQATGRAGILLWYSFVALTLSLVGFVGGLHWGIVGVAAGYAVASVFIESYYTLLTARALDLPFRSVLANLSGVAQASAGMLVCVLALGTVLPDMADAARLAILVAAGVLSYAVFCLWRAPEVLAEARGLRRDRTRADAVPGTS
ncbi:MAG TPA: MOP flippase family protein [Gaiellaceae bacterium]|nr:MOP flippase family protein [Gaiellaceae bacterium]